MTKTLASALVLGLLGLAGCSDSKTDASGPTVEFDPSAAIFPFPNNLVLDPTSGRVNLPPQCDEGIPQAVIRTTLLDTLDGFGTYESALQVTFSEAVDPTTLDGHVILFQRVNGTAANDPATAKPIPVTLSPGMTMQFSADCSTSQMGTSLTIIAQGVLEQRSTYTVVLTKGIKTASGSDFGPSSTWALVGQASVPVTLDAHGNVTANHTSLNPSDQVVPNVATNNEGALVGLSGAMADPANATSNLPPSAAIATNPTANKFVKYVNLAPSAGTGFPGNTFEHASLLLPATTVEPGNPPPGCNRASGFACDACWVPPGSGQMPSAFS